MDNQIMMYKIKMQIINHIFFIHWGNEMPVVMASRQHVPGFSSSQFARLAARLCGMAQWRGRWASDTSGTMASPWRTEVGLDLDHSDYAFEHVSHSHVRLELKDVVLTSALWRFLVGPILPLTVQEGQVDQVSREGEWGCLVTFRNTIFAYNCVYMIIYDK